MYWLALLCKTRGLAAFFSQKFTYYWERKLMQTHGCSFSNPGCSCLKTKRVKYMCREQCTEQHRPRNIISEKFKQEQCWCKSKQIQVSKKTHGALLVQVLAKTAVERRKKYFYRNARTVHIHMQWLCRNTRMCTTGSLRCTRRHVGLERNLIPLP